MKQKLNAERRVFEYLQMSLTHLGPSLHTYFDVSQAYKP